MTCKTSFVSTDGPSHGNFDFGDHPFKIMFFLPYLVSFLNNWGLCGVNLRPSVPSFSHPHDRDQTASLIILYQILLI